MVVPDRRQVEGHEPVGVDLPWLRDVLARRVELRDVALGVHRDRDAEVGVGVGCVFDTSSSRCAPSFAETSRSRRDAEEVEVGGDAAADGRRELEAAPGRLARLSIRSWVSAKKPPAAVQT